MSSQANIVNIPVAEDKVQLYQEMQLLHDRVCKAIGDPKRMMIIYALSQEPLYVSELAEQLDFPQPTVSRHLNSLYQSGLVVKERRGQAVYYALRDERIVEVLNLLRLMLGDIVQENVRVTSGSSIENTAE